MASQTSMSMTRAGRQRLIVFVVVTALVGLAGWQVRRDDVQVREHTLLAIEPASITHIELAFRGGSAQRYTRRDGHWSLDAATPSPADDGRLGELTALAGSPVYSWRPIGDFEPAKIGLVPPLATLHLDGQMLEYGELTAVGEQRYVRIGDRVALVPAQAFPRPASGKAIR
jgi:hypothetical protein